MRRGLTVSSLWLTLFAVVWIITPSPSARGAEAAWGYHGEIGPEHWGSLDPAYALCDTGLEQSPINLEEENGGCAPFALSFSYRSHIFDLLHTGETVKATPRGTPSSITLAGQRYNLIQIHWHTPSEHAIESERRPIEMHFVHQNANGQLAVVGVMINRGNRNAAMDGIFSRLPQTAGGTRVTASINAASMLPSNRTTRWSYNGSLTTPACGQGVRWTVLRSPIQMSAAQIAAFTALFSGADFPEGNSRPVQPRNNRAVCTSGI